MAERDVRQRLAAILAADVAGYSRLMGDDERATVVALDACRDIFRTHVTGHGGRVVDTAGDSVLAVFELATSAVDAAVAIQAALAVRNAPLSDDRRMRFRIGIHIGEVLTKPDGTIYGDGVNIAARLEAIAQVDGICVSDMVHGAVRGRVDKSFENLGEQEIKNIAEPVRAFRLVLSDEARGKTTRQRPVFAIGAAVLVLGLVVALAWWQFTDRPGPAAPPRVERSIAVLPFTNMSGEAEQEYFADGISEDLITELSRFEGLLVIARNSSFRFKGQAVDVTEVAKALGVRYVLEGGVRRTGERVRITAQLIDADTGGHLWAERYDRELTDVFAVQDDVTRQIVAALETKIGGLTPTRGFKPLSSSHEAYDLFLRGRVEKERRTAQTNQRARELFAQAIALDPTFAAAYAELSDAQYLAWNYGFSDDLTLEIALATAEKAIALDRALPAAHVQLGRRYMWLGRFEESLAAINAAIALDANFAAAYAAHAYLSLFTADYALTRTIADRAMRLDPYAARPVYYRGMA
ncbi:MAG: adenylate/guanylate cyclase domain-containing protein, partial [Alphaproteobacteria bacterium]|nr:adenylate/guanylate cyclase domain-containing protein [Alphaproteobacteria bacterium]